jgi:hypothetical protein
MASLGDLLKTLEREFITSLITVILAILSIAIYIIYRSRLIFYVVVGITIAFGLYNVWLISRLEKEPTGSSQPVTRKKTNRGKANS